MKNIDDGIKWIVAIFVVLLLGGITGLQCQKENNEWRKSMADLGYRQVTIQGSAALVWQPACPPCSTGAKGVE